MPILPLRPRKASGAIHRGRSGLPFLRGKRIVLRPLREEDAYGPYAGWLNDAKVCAGNRHHRFPYGVADALAYIQQSRVAKDQIALAIVHQETERHIGNIALKRVDYIDRSAELVILVGEQAYWGQGYGQEAAQLLLDHAFFTLNLHRVSCGTFESNTGMRRLVGALGMREEGRRREAAFKQHSWLDVIEYGVLRHEYVARFGARTVPARRRARK